MVGSLVRRFSDLRVEMCKQLPDYGTSFSRGSGEKASTTPVSLRACAPSESQNDVVVSGKVHRTSNQIFLGVGSEKNTLLLRCGLVTCSHRAHF